MVETTGSINPRSATKFRIEKNLPVFPENEQAYFNWARILESKNLFLDAK